MVPVALALCSRGLEFWIVFRVFLCAVVKHLLPPASTRSWRILRESLPSRRVAAAVSRARWWRYRALRRSGEPEYTHLS